MKFFRSLALRAAVIAPAFWAGRLSAISQNFLIAPNITVTNPSDGGSIGCPLSSAQTAIQVSWQGVLQPGSFRAILDANPATGAVGTPLSFTVGINSAKGFLPATFSAGNHILSVSGYFPLLPAVGGHGPLWGQATVDIHFTGRYSELTWASQTYTVAAGSPPTTVTLNQTGFIRDAPFSLGLVSLAPLNQALPVTNVTPASGTVRGGGSFTFQVTPGLQTELLLLNATDTDLALPALAGQAQLLTVPQFTSLVPATILWTPDLHPIWKITARGAGFDKNTRLIGVFNNRPTQFLCDPATVTATQATFTIPVPQIAKLYQVSVGETIAGQLLASTSTQPLTIQGPPVLAISPATYTMMIGENLTLSVSGNTSVINPLSVNLNPAEFPAALGSPLAQPVATVATTVSVPTNSPATVSLQAVGAGTVAMIVDGPNGASSNVSKVTVDAYQLSVSPQPAVFHQLVKFTIRRAATNQDDAVSLVVNGSAHQILFTNNSTQVGLSLNCSTPVGQSITAVVTAGGQTASNTITIPVVAAVQPPSGYSSISFEYPNPGTWGTAVTVWAYDSSTQAWSSIQTLGQGQTSSSYALKNNQIYFFYAFDPSVTDPASGSVLWQTTIPLLGGNGPVYPLVQIVPGP